MISEAIRSAVEGRDLEPDLMKGAMSAILAGDTTAAQIAALVVALRMKGETPSEIAAAAQAMREHSAAIRPNVSGPLLDTCGTGGDGLHTFNISTATAIVVAACGVPIAKHGNRAVSSKAGSADVLSALGVNIELEPAQVQHCIEEVGIGFLFAPKHHQAMRHAAPVRKELGLRTIFNLLGPLSNPASASHQVVGVYDAGLVEPLARALGELGLKGAWVVHGEGGMDEITPYGTTTVARLRRDDVEVSTLAVADFGIDEVTPESLVGGDADENAAIIRSVLKGASGGPRAAVVVNAAAALCVAGAAASPAEGASQASSVLDSGAAADKLEQWARLTQQ